MGRLDAHAGVQLQAVWGDAGPAEAGRLLLVIHHLVVDGVSWGIVQSDLASAYASAARGQPIELPPKTTSLRHWAEQLQASAPLRRTELPFWQDMTTRAAPALLAGALDAARDTVASAGHFEHRLDEATTRALLTDVPAAFHARVNDVLLSALVLAVADWRGAAHDSLALRLDLEGHGRESADARIDLTRTVGWFTSVYPLHLDPGALDLHEALQGGPAAGVALKRIKEQLRAVPGQGLGYGVLRQLDAHGAAVLQGLPGAQLAFNYLGRFALGQGAHWQPAEAADALLGGADAQRPLEHAISINAITLDTAHGPRLSVGWRFAAALLGAPEAQRLAHCFERALQALVRHARRPGAGGLTPSDIEWLALEQRDIDELEQRDIDELEQRDIGELEQRDIGELEPPHPRLHDIWPLTPLQEGLLFHAHYEDQGEDPYLVQLAFELHGALDGARLRRALDALLQRHANLRVAFCQDRTGRSLQLVQAHCTMPWREHDLQDLSDGRQRAAALEAEDRRVRFDPARAPLMRATLLRLGPAQHRLLLTQHHVLVDGWSGPILLQDLLALYRHDAQDHALPAPVPFKHYLAWLQAQDKAAARAAWRQTLAGIDSPTLLAPPGRAAAAGVQAQHDQWLDAASTRALEALARAHGLTLATLLQGAWAVLLARLTGRRDVLFGNVSSGRQAPLAGIERMLGLLITTTPLRVRVEPARPVLEWLQQLQREQAALQPHQHLALAELHRLAGAPVLFDTLFTYENYPAGAGSTPTGSTPAGEHELPLREVRGNNGNHYPLSLAALPGARLGLRLHYNRALFDSAAIQAIGQRLARLLQQIVQAPHARLHRLDILDAPERARLLHGFNDTAAALPEATLIERFEQQVARTPQACALRFEDDSLSYAQLEARANRLAHLLVARGIAAEQFVAICLPRSLELVVAILATLKTGAAYLPLDAQYPSERIAFLLEDAAPRALITCSAAASGLPSALASSLASTLPSTLPSALPAGLPVLVLDEPRLLAELEALPAHAPRRLVPPHPQHPAYLIYTSGSTGQPKGVVVPHHGLPNLAHAQVRHIGVTQESRVAQLASFSFDAAYSELAMALSSGATLVLAPEHARSAEPLAQFLRDMAISHATFTPTVLQTLDATHPTSLNHIIVAGEPCPKELWRAWGLNCIVSNAYGPTEASVCTTMSAASLDAGPSLPIGAPIAHTRAYVLDAALQPCPVGVVGELYIAGAGLARGYWRRAALTAERFVPDPHALAPGQRMYRSGDLAAWRDDGQLVFYGRADRQLKIRGFRIEPAEIEAALLRHPGIAGAAVVTRDDDASGRKLMAYVVPDLNAPANRSLLHELAQQQIESWQDIETSLVREPADPSFDTSGWDSSYDGRPFPPAEMREYVDTSVARIRALQPGRVLEIGCGAGLILFRLLPHCTRYTGIDLSGERIRRLQTLQSMPQWQERIAGLAGARFVNARADELDGFGAGAIDTVLLPSVAQYFPSLDHLSAVLDTILTTTLADGGSVFVGDVRNLALQAAFHTSVVLHKASPGDRSAALAERVRSRLAAERELAIEPGYFLALARRHPRIRHVEILPKLGAADNELTRFRYDVLIRLSAQTQAAAALPWVDWLQRRDDLATLRRTLLVDRPQVLAIRGIANARVAAAVAAADQLLYGEHEAPGSVPWRGPDAPATGWNPDDLVRISAECGYRVDLGLRACAGDGSYDAVLRPAAAESLPLVSWDDPQQELPRRLANNPLQDRLRRHLAPRLRTHLEGVLPDYMVPAGYVVLESLPLTPNGKLDRRALPLGHEGGVVAGYQAPGTQAEVLLCELVAQLLGLERVGVADNFFHLGGDSIGSIRLVSAARERGLLFSPREVFLHPVLGELARVAQQAAGAVSIVQGTPEGALPATPIMRWLLQHSGPWGQFHQAVLLQVPAALDEAALVAALQALLEHHDALRLQCLDDGALRIAPPGAVHAHGCVQRLALSGLAPAQRRAALQQAYEEAVGRLDAHAGVQLQAVWGDAGPAEAGRLLLVIHHLVVDGVSWGIVQSDLASAYASAARGQPIELPPKTTSLRHWAEQLQASAPLRRTELPFWQDMTTRAAPALLAGALDAARDTVASAGHFEHRLDEATTRALLTDVPAAFHARVNDVLLSALVLAVADWRGAAHDSLALRLDLEGHGRESADARIDLTRTVGWFTSVYPLHLDPGALDLHEALQGGPAAGVALKRIKEQLRAVPGQGLGYGVLRQLDAHGAAVLQGLPGAQLAFNYLGRFALGQGAHWQPAEAADALLGGADAQRPLEHAISINAITLDTAHGPRLSVGWRFAAALLGAPEAQRLAHCFERALQALVRHARRPGAGGLTPSDIEWLALEQRDIDELEQRDIDELEQRDIGELEPPHPRLHDIWPLTPLQEGLLFHAHYEDQGEDPYLVQLAFELHGALDGARLRRALDALLQRHANLRVAFCQDRTGRLLQLVQAHCTMPWREHDLQDLSDGRQRAAALEAEDRRVRFDPARAPLMRATLLRLGPAQHRLLLTQHHVLVDGWSGPILLEDLLALYRHDAQDHALPAPVPFKHYLAWLQAQDKAAARAAWRQTLAGIDSPTLLAPPGRAAAAGVQAQHDQWLDAASTRALEALARAHGLTLATLLQGAWAVLLARLTGRRDVLFGNVSSGRQAPLAGIERMLGLLITTTPLRVRVEPARPVLEWLQQLQREQAALQPHQHLALAELHRLAGAPVLFDTLFTYENYPAGAGSTPTGSTPAGEHELPLREVRGNNGNHYPLSLAALPGARLGLRLHYNRALFDSAAIQAIGQRLARLLQQIVQAPHARLHRLDILDAPERARLLHGFNDTAAALPEATLIERFEQQVARTPQACALRFEDDSLSYAQLEARANRLAHLLVARGIAAEQFVAICLPRSLELVVAILATLKTGAAYLPLDAQYPSERIAFLLEDAAPRALITCSEQAGVLAPALAAELASGPAAGLASAMPVLMLDQPQLLAQLDAAPTHAPQRLVPPHPQHPAYLIYTSGSTGQPKGVVNTLQNVARLFDATRPWFRFDERDTWTLFHSYAFDFSVSELWGALLHGGRLVIVPELVAKSPPDMRRLMARHGVTVLNQTTAAFHQLVQADAEAGAAEPGCAPRVVIFGGEACPPGLGSAWAGRCAVLHAYGPTESTVFATMSPPLADNGPDDVPPIGAPIAHTRAYVLDAALQPCPVGVVGELYIAGAGLARGYWRRAALTAERFVPDPHALAPGQRMYRSGDLAAWRDDGQLVFHGRADRQLKIRGFRIEPAEIEAVLARDADIAEAVVVARTDASGDKRLVAYVVPRKDHASPLDLEAVQRRLASRLPQHMVPSALVPLDAIPLNINGKVDREALPAPDGFGIVSTSHVEPSTPEQILLCRIVAQLLDVPRVGLSDHFFHLGGHSMTAARLVALVRAKLGRELSIQAVYEHPVLGDLAKRIGLVDDAERAFGLLLPIRAHGTRTPAFCIHPGTGLCWPYMNLLRVTAEDQPLYGIQARGFGDDDRLAESLDEIVSDSLQQLRSVQPAGPYKLAGWSFGGVVAHMMATRLQAQREVVERLLLFDAYPPLPQAPAASADRGGDIWRQIARGTNLKLPDGLNGTPLDGAMLGDIAREQSHLLGAFPLHRLERMGAVLANNSRLLDQAALAVFHGDITLYVAARKTAGLELLDVDAQAWAPHCSGAIRTATLDVEHHHMMSDAAIRQFGSLPL